MIRLVRTCSKVSIALFAHFHGTSSYILVYSQLKPFTLDAILDFLKGLNIVLSAMLAIGP
jgi:hypothetical protein